MTRLLTTPCGENVAVGIVGDLTILVDRAGDPQRGLGDSGAIGSTWNRFVKTRVT